MNYKTFEHLSNDIKKNLYKIHNKSYDLVVGIPRSGMVPAYFIAAYLNISVTDVNSLITNQPLKKPSVRRLKNPIDMAHDAKNILLVDDSIISGNSLQETLDSIPKQLKDKITTLVIYSDRPRRDDVSQYLEVLPTPRVFEWNIFHRPLLKRACVDIDGVLCLDPSPEQNDDGKNYVDFLLNAKPYILPSYKIHSLVTSRLEKYRSHTEEWLKKHNILYENLIMLDLPDKDSRLKINAHAAHKAAYYKKSTNLEIFIESNGKQAEQIVDITGKPCYCVDENFMYIPGIINLSTKNPRSLYRQTKHLLVLNMPHWLKSILRPLYFFIVGKKRR